MKIKRYLGTNTQEAMIKIKMDLGKDAVILSTKKVRQKGFFGIFKKPMIEMLAAADEEVKPKVEPGSSLFEASGNKNSKPSNENEKIDKIENKMNNIEELLKKMFLSPETANSEVSEGSSTSKPNMKLIDKFYSNLLENDVDKFLADDIKSKVIDLVGDSTNIDEIAKAYQDLVNGILGSASPLTQIKAETPTVVVFTGPTGVGKTTTIAKLAAGFTLSSNKKVGLITADTYRIAAVEQLKTYGEILNIPVKVVYNPDDLKKAIDDYSDMDFIFIDTAGRSHKNREQFDELSRFIKEAQADLVYLVISLTSSSKNIFEILQEYDFLENFKIIFTKTDEVQSQGLILNVCAKVFPNVLSYYTFGQSVPDDIELVEVPNITKNLLWGIK